MGKREGKGRGAKVCVWPLPPTLLLHPCIMGGAKKKDKKKQSKKHGEVIQSGSSKFKPGEKKSDWERKRDRKVRDKAINKAREEREVQLSIVKTTSAARTKKPYVVPANKRGGRLPWPKRFELKVARQK